LIVVEHHGISISAISMTVSCLQIVNVIDVAWIDIQRNGLITTTKRGDGQDTRNLSWLWWLSDAASCFKVQRT